MKLSSKVKKVYVAEYNNNFKIGVSNNVDKRIRQLACGCPTIEIVYQSDYLSNAFEIEKRLQNFYHARNIGGEWFSYVDIEKIKKIIEEHGTVADYEKIREKESAEISNNLKSVINEFYIIPNSNQNEVDTRDMTLEELKYENEQIYKFGLSVGGADIPNIYSDLIYNIMFGRNTEQLIKEYKANKFESFRNHLSDKQNEKIMNYTHIIGEMINAYWTFEKIEKYVTMIEG